MRARLRHSLYAQNLSDEWKNPWFPRPHFDRGPPFHPRVPCVPSCQSSASCPRLATASQTSSHARTEKLGRRALRLKRQASIPGLDSPPLARPSPSGGRWRELLQAGAPASPAPLLPASLGTHRHSAATSYHRQRNAAQLLAGSQRNLESTGGCGSSSSTRIARPPTAHLPTSFNRKQASGSCHPPSSWRTKRRPLSWTSTSPDPDPAIPWRADIHERDDDANRQPPPTAERASRSLVGRAQHHEPPARRCC